ncbi:MAG: hypothetical protein B7Y31_12785 [Novosphingobium sp. 16-62-11]|nr:MAG: hypothetical protein B7Y74_13930 [Novosphingobium sp. 35-62-5]OYZ30159.1 MAG: hypothetical protein B7Y31_12785 [Novosphingobium sp. 16-62-11]OZA68645.1 MAG: hypothetical protein B7X78_03570 [Sphingomonadales bacterium 39-62-4]
MVGATGTIGRATVAALVARGYAVTCLLRRSDAKLSAQTSVIEADVASPAALTAVFAQGRFDAIVSCLASRTGVPADAWAIDHRANLNVLEAAQRSGVQHFILLSAICVQKPLLAFQHAKLAFESALAASSIRYSIVRLRGDNYDGRLSGDYDGR